MPTKRLFRTFACYLNFDGRASWLRVSASVASGACSSTSCTSTTHALPSPQENQCRRSPSMTIATRRAGLERDGGRHAARAMGGARCCGALGVASGAAVTTGMKQMTAWQEYQRGSDWCGKCRGKGCGARPRAVAAAWIAGAAGRRLSQAMVALLVVAVADASELVSVGSCPASSQPDHGTFLFGILVGIAIGACLTTCTWWACSRGKVTMQPHQVKPQRAMRSIMTQSQVTYTRKWTQPRFHLLSDEVQGVAIDLQDYMRTASEFAGACSAN
jgi:hypothetical protein